MKTACYVNLVKRYTYKFPDFTISLGLKLKEKKVTIIVFFQGNKLICFDVGYIVNFILYRIMS